MMKTLPLIDELSWIAAVKEICSELGWTCRVNSAGENSIILCPLPADKNFKGVFFVISGEARRISVYVTYRINVAQNHWNSMAQTIARVNCGLLGGCLEVDQSQGEVRYRDGLLLPLSAADTELLRTMVGTSLKESLRYKSVIENFLSESPPNIDSIADSSS